MKKRISKKKLGRTSSHRSALVKNQLRSLFENGALVTTSVKAKVLKNNAQSLLDKANPTKSGLTQSRTLYTLLDSEALVANAIKVAQSGVTGVKIMKIGFRSGDNAEVSKVVLEGFASTSSALRKKGATKSDAKGELKEEKKATKKDSPKRKDEGGVAKKFTQAIKGAVTGSKERVRTRSGL